MPRPRCIRTQPSVRYNTSKGYWGSLSGRLAGKKTRLYISCVVPHDEYYTLAMFRGQKLYRLAKAIVQQYEKGKDA